MYCQPRFPREFEGFGDFLGWLKQSLFTTRQVMEQESAAGFPHQPGRWRSGETRSLGNSDAPEQSGACTWVTRLSTKWPRDIITHSSRYSLPTIYLYIIASCLCGRFKASCCKLCKVEIAVVHLFRCTLLQGLSQGSCTGCFTPCRWLYSTTSFPKSSKIIHESSSFICDSWDKTQAI